MLWAFLCRFLKHGYAFHSSLAHAGEWTAGICGKTVLFLQEPQAALQSPGTPLWPQCYHGCPSTCQLASSDLSAPAAPTYWEWDLTVVWICASWPLPQTSFSPHMLTVLWLQNPTLYFSHSFCVFSCSYLKTCLFCGNCIVPWGFIVKVLQLSVV